MHIGQGAVNKQTFRGGRITVPGLGLHKEAVLGAGDERVGLKIRGDNAFRGDDISNQRTAGAAALNRRNGGKSVAAAKRHREAKAVVANHIVRRVVRIVVAHFRGENSHGAGLTGGKVGIRVQGIDRVFVGYLRGMRAG